MKKPHLQRIRLLFVFFLFSAGVLNAELSDAKIQSITEHLQDYWRNWTVKDTRELLKDAGEHAMQFTSIVGDNGKEVKITIAGGTVLVEGKDINGNLGSKTTYG